MKYLILLSLLLLNWNFSLPIEPNKNMEGINLKLSPTIEQSPWQNGGKMPVNVAITNDSPMDVCVKVHSIRFHLSPEKVNYVRTFIVPTNNTPKEIALKKGETVNQKYELSDINYLDYVSNSSESEEYRNNLRAGKYKLTVLFQTISSDIHHSKSLDLLKPFESSIEVNFADKNSVSANEPTSADEKLLNTTLFVLGQSNKGYASVEEVALREILSRQNAVDSFISLIDRGSPEGKLYGLLGLKLLKCECFNEQLEIVKKTINLQIRINTEENIPLGRVRIQNGCKISHADSLEMVERIVNGDYDKILETKVDKQGKIIR